jgi:hypothetical protein
MVRRGLETTMARGKIEDAIRDAVRDHALEFGEDNFEITVIVSMDREDGMLNIDTDIEFESH